MLRLFLRSMAAHVRSGRTLFTLSVLGVALGVASVLSIQIINQGALGAFEGSVRAISGDADFTIYGRTPRIDEQLYPRVLADADVAAAWPVYRHDVALAGESEQFLEILGIDFFAAMQIPWDADSEPADAVGASSPISTPAWVAVSAQFAAERGLAVGDTFRVTSGSLTVPLTVGALVDFKRFTPLAGSRLAVMDIAGLQNLFAPPSGVHQIGVLAREGADVAALRARLERALGPTVTTATSEQRRDDAAGLLAAFRFNLTALSMISLFVGGFLVFMTMRAALVRRRQEFGLLRSVGAGKGQVVGVLAGEVALLGLLGVGLGIPLGWAAATFSVGRVSATLSNLYMLEEIERLALPPRLWLLATAIGLAGALAGAAGPASEIVRADPRRLLAAFTLRDRVAANAGKLFAAGVATLAVALGGWALWLRDVGWGGFALATALLIAIPLMAPALVERLTDRVPLSGFGARYGLKALGLRLQTAAYAVAALAVAVSMLVGITVMIGSFRRTVEVWLGTTLAADVYVTTESWRRAREAAAIEPALLAELEAVDGVDQVDRLRTLTVWSGERQIPLGAVDMGLALLSDRFELLEGDMADASRRMRDEDAVLIAEPLARKERLGIGDTLPMTTPAGEVRLPIAGVFYDYSSERGGAVMDLAVLERLFGAGPITNVALYLDPDRDAEAVAASLKARYADTGLMVRSNRDIREEVFVIFDQTFAVTRLLQGMSLVIAVCGITLTLIVLARERVSELALYRALGARRRQIFRVFVGKGLGIALFGMLLGAVGGVLLAAVLIFVINRTWFGWTIAVYWPWWSLVQGFLFILVAAVVASVYPALRASRVPATELARENL